MVRYHSAGGPCPIPTVATTAPTMRRRRGGDIAVRVRAASRSTHAMTQRGTTHTPPWHQRLAWPIAVSLALHGAVMAVRPPTVRFPSLPVEINRTVEFGLETARPATSPTPTPAPPTPPGPTPTPPRPPPRAAAPRRAAPRPSALPDPPDMRLREPSLVREPDSVLLAERRDSGSLEDAALALNDAGSMEDVALAMTDAGSMEDVALALTDTAPPSDVEPGAVPTMAQAAGAMAAAIPEGAVVTMLLRTDRLREGPHAQRVGALLDGIRDWQAVLGGTEIDPVRDFDAVLLASANPFGTRAHPPDLMAIVRTHARRDFLRASVEQMAGVRASTPSGPLPPDAGTLRDHFTHPDGTPLPRPTRSIWTRRNGVETTTVDRYLGPTSVALLEDDLAVFSSPQRMPTLLAVLGGQTAVASALPRSEGSARGPRLVALLTARGVRNLLSAPGRSNPVPVSAEFAIQATRDPGGDDDGGATLRSTWRYDSPEQAAAAARLVGAFALDLRESIDQFAGTLGGRAASATGTVHFPVLRRALTRLSATAEGATVRLDATLDQEEVTELLNVQRLAGLFQ